MKKRYSFFLGFLLLIFFSFKIYIKYTNHFDITRIRFDKPKLYGFLLYQKKNIFGLNIIRILNLKTFEYQDLLEGRKLKLLTLDKNPI